MTPAKMEKIVEDYVGGAKEGTEFEIAFFGGSFTAIEPVKRKRLLEKAKECILRFPQIKQVHISTRPDAIDDEILEELKRHFVKVIELGVQSLDEEVLARSNRGHGVSCVYESAEKIKGKGFRLGLQMMTALPGDSAEKSIETAKKFVCLKPNFVRIYPALVIKDTELSLQMERGEFTPWTLEESVALVKKLKTLFSFYGIEVIRMGLQPTETVSMGASVLAGPFHPAFGELVYSAMYRDFLERYFHKKRERIEYSTSVNKRSEKKEMSPFCDKVEIAVDMKQLSKWIGNRRSTLSYFKDNYNIDPIFKGREMDGLEIEGLRYTQRQLTEELYLLYFS